MTQLILHIAVVLLFLRHGTGAYISNSNFQNKNELSQRELMNFKDSANHAQQDITSIENASCECENGDCVEEKGKPVCQCWPEYGKLRESKCVACNCGKESNCTVKEGGLFESNTITCICKEGYKVKGKTCIGPCTNNPCKEGGSCIDVPGDYKCQCRNGYGGRNCTERDVCYGKIRCKNGGTCTTTSYNRFKCDCLPPFGGPICEKVIVSSTSSSTSTMEINTSKEPISTSPETPSTSISEITDVSEPVTSSIETPSTSISEITDVSEPVPSSPETPSTSISEITDVSVPVTLWCRSNKDCLNGGICKYGRRGSFCECRHPFKGDNCEINEICESLKVTCNAIGAVCTYFEWLRKGFCECPPTKIYNRTLKKCEDICQPTSCIHGTCEVMDYQQKCRCDNGYDGCRCEKKILPESDNTGYVIAFGILCAACPLFSTFTLIIYFGRLKKAKISTQ